MNNSINRQTAIDAWKEDFKGFVNWLDMPRDDYRGIMEYIDELPSARPDSSTCWGCNCHKMQLLEKAEPHEIGYSECANVMLKMWIDNVLTDGEYNRIMDKLNAHWTERREDG